MSIHQFLEKTDQEKKSVCVNKSLRREQDGGSLVYSYTFPSTALLPVLLNFWNTNPFIDAYNIFTLRNELFYLANGMR